MAPPSLKTFREIRAAFLARTVTITAAMHGLLGLGLPGAIAMDLLDTWTMDLLDTWTIERRG